MNKITMTRRYYVGSSSITRDSTFLKTLVEATQTARELVESGQFEERVVVEVVRIVRRAQTPVIVEEVRK